MFSHECHKQNLVDFEVRRPLITYYVVSNCFNKLFMVVVSCSFILQIYVWICAHTFRIVQLHMDLVCPQHINRYQVYYSFLPSVWSWEVQVAHSFDVIIFDFVQGALMCHISLSNNERHRVHLQKYQVRLRFADSFNENVFKSTV